MKTLQDVFKEGLYRTIFLDFSPGVGDRVLIQSNDNPPVMVMITLKCDKPWCEGNSESFLEAYNLEVTEAVKRIEAFKQGQL